MICSGRETLQEILMEPGFFRIGASSIDVVECPLASACNSTATRTFGDSLCAQQMGHEGPLCMVCRVNDAETYYWEGEQCLKCEGEKTNGIIASAVVIALGILLGILKRLGIVAKVTKAVTEAAWRRFP